MASSLLMKRLVMTYKSFPALLHSEILPSALNSIILHRKQISMTEVFCFFSSIFTACMVPDLSALKQNEVIILLKRSVVVFTFIGILIEFG